MLGDVYRAQNKLKEAALKYDDAFKVGTNNWLMLRRQAMHTQCLILQKLEKDLTKL